MENGDARSLDHNTLEALRICAVCSVQAGENSSVVVRALGLTVRTMCCCLVRYRRGGLKAKALFGRPPKLNARLMQWISNTEAQKNPLQMQIPFALWTPEMMATVIKRKFYITPAANFVGRLLAQIGITYQKPLHRAIECNESLVWQWIEKEYPKIKATAKKQGADIYFGDAAHIRSNHHAGRTSEAKGDTHIIQATDARHGMGLISAVTSHGYMRFMIIDKGSINADVILEFIKRLIKGAERKIFLIVDHGSAHRAKKVSAFVQTLGGKLRLFFQPPYALDRGPDELV